MPTSQFDMLTDHQHLVHIPNEAYDENEADYVFVHPSNDTTLPIHFHQSEIKIKNKIHSTSIVPYRL